MSWPSGLAASAPAARIEPDSRKLGLDLAYTSVVEMV
jgi:hypothetical protein